MNEQFISLIADALRKEGILDKNTLAYALATIEHETAGTFQPIAEYGGREQARRLGYSGGEKYYGRGYIQLTHDYNYRDIGRAIGLGDALLKNPDLALRPDIAARIFAKFFKDKGVANYASRGDFLRARLPVNGTDRAWDIANKAARYLSQIPDVQPKKVGGFQLSDTPQVSSSAVFSSKSPGINDAVKTLFSSIVPQAQAQTNIPSQITPRAMNYQPSQGPASFAPGTIGGASYNRPTQNYTPANQYTVQSGDNLWNIAQRTLGAGNRWRELGYQGNPNQMPIGTKLNIPVPIQQPRIPRPNFSPTNTSMPSRIVPRYIA